MTTSRRTLGNLPNVLSCSRLVLAAGFVVTDGANARVGLIGVAAVTDFLDGWLAASSKGAGFARSPHQGSQRSSLKPT